MSDLRKAAEMALDALKDTHYRIIDAGLLDQDLLNRNFTVATELRQALAQPEQEPVAWMKPSGLVSPYKHGSYQIPLYTAPPKREWVSLTDEDYEKLLETKDWGGSLIEAVEKKLKEKNGF